MNITADTVRQLRERTGAGMMECKRALVETQGDLDAAAELMRKAGLSKADKKAARVAAEGTLAIERDGRAAVMVEVNCETDFVARGDDFQKFARAVAQAALTSSASGPEALLAVSAHGQTLDQQRRALIAKIGENVTLRRFGRLTAPTSLGSYLHGTRIGVLIAVQGGDESLAHDLAMHVAAVNPAYIDSTEAPADLLAKEREILAAQVKGEKKPPEIIAKMIEGRLRKYLADITLTGQPFVKDPQMSVAALLEKSGARVVEFLRFEVGAGIEKKHDDFVGEVMAQVKNSG